MSVTAGAVAQSVAGLSRRQPGETALFVHYTCLPPSLWTYREIKGLIPWLCDTGCKRALVLEMEVRVSVRLIIIIIIRLYIAINELQWDLKPIQSINLCESNVSCSCPQWSKATFYSLFTFIIVSTLYRRVARYGSSLFRLPCSRAKEQW